MEDWIGYWTYLSQRTLGGWSTVTRKLRAREDYRLQDIAADAMDYWMDMFLASCAVWRGPETKPRVLLFRLDVDDGCAGAKSVPVFPQRLPHRDPSVLWVGAVEGPAGPGVQIQEKHIQASISEDGTELEVKLVGLLPEDRGHLAPATYRALIHIDEVPLAEVFIGVEKMEVPGERPIIGKGAKKPPKGGTSRSSR